MKNPLHNLSVNMRSFVYVLMAFAMYSVADACLNNALDIYFFAEVVLYPIIVFGFIILIMHKKFGGMKSFITTPNKKWLILRAIAGTCVYLCVIFSFKYLTMAEAYTIFLTAPFWVSLLAFFWLKEKVGPHRWISISIVFIGVLFVMIPGMALSEHKLVYILPVIAAVSFAFFNNCTKYIGEKESLFNLVMYPILVEIIVLVPLILWNISYGDGYTTPAPRYIFAFIIAGILFLTATCLSTLGFQKGEPSMLAPLHYTQIIWGMILGALFLGETPSLWTIIGAGIIIGSGIYLLYRENKAAKRKHAITAE